MLKKARSLSDISWQEFQGLPLTEKAGMYSKDGRLFHVIVAQQFNRAILEELGAMATRIRHIAKIEAGMDFLRTLLSHKSAMLYFSQPSTRTFLSFHSACQILGMRTVEVREASTSSEVKGETQEDSVRTFSSFSDVIIMRHSIGGLAEKMAWTLSNTERPIPIINAGSGKDQHPTQALLDIYTLQRSFENRGGIDGKKIVFVGDLARGRTVRSLAQLLTYYKGVEQVFIAPPQLQIKDDILALLKASNTRFEVGSDFAKAVPEADAIYMTRIQDEWDETKGESGRIDTSQFCLGPEHLSKLKPDAVIMHPLPRRNEIAIEIDRDPRAVYWRQVRNGMWVRVALLVHIFNVFDKIREFHD